MTRHPADTPQITQPADDLVGRAANIVKRIWAKFLGQNNPTANLAKEAATIIEQQAKRIAELEAARTPNPGKTHFADDATLAYIAKLEAENFALAAGQCVIDGGLCGDQHGNQYCAVNVEKMLADEELAAIKNVGMEPVAIVAFDHIGWRHMVDALRGLSDGDGLYSAVQLAKVIAERNEAKAELAAYREANEDHKRLVRELDVVWNGEVGAAKQASLCDVVSQLSREVPQRRAELLALHEILMCPGECPPIAEGDTLTVRLLKGYIAAVGKVQMDRDEEIRISSLRGEKIEELLAQWSAACAEREELSAQIERANACAERAKLVPEWDRMPHAIHVELDALFKALTPGNAVQAIEARALREAADKFDAEDERELFSGGIADELRTLAEQKEKGS